MSLTVLAPDIVSALGKTKCSFIILVENMDITTTVPGLGTLVFTFFCTFFANKIATLFHTFWDTYWYTYFATFFTLFMTLFMGTHFL